MSREKTGGGSIHHCLTIIIIIINSSSTFILVQRISFIFIRIEIETSISISSFPNFKTSFPCQLHFIFTRDEWRFLGILGTLLPTRCSKSRNSKFRKWVDIYSKIIIIFILTNIPINS